MSNKKTLFIVRHAKSSWDYEGIADVDRPLKIRGISNAYEMARRLKIARNIPDTFISSPANRALHTAMIFIKVFELKYERLKIDKRLYSHGIDDILQLIKLQPDSVKKLMIFGHNPDFSDLASIFTKQNFIDLPTCGMVIFSFDTAKWENVNRENVISENLDFPKKE
ncbi:MAG: histidine phosphatase family protein [Bacteroidales bacterium]|nr:histidine phosphatase family protein [Bacteroidales bacterium]